MYVCGGNQQLKIFDISDPVDPQLMLNCQSEIPNWSTQVGYVHDIYVRDNIAFCNAEDALWAVDFNDIEAPVFLGDLSGYIEAGYNHSGWLRPDGNYYALADETHGTRIKLVDVSDFTDMEIVSWFGTESHPQAIAHNLIFKDNILHVSYYHDGYQVWDTTDPSSPERVAYFDTSNEPHTTNYRGCWGIYPFLPSGVVLASDMQEGLFVFNVDLGETNSIAEAALAEVAVYPNPAIAGQKLFVELPADRASGRVEIYSAEGLLVDEASLSTTTGPIGSISLPTELASGIYLLRIFAGELTSTARVVVR